MTKIVGSKIRIHTPKCHGSATALLLVLAIMPTTPSKWRPSTKQTSSARAASCWRRAKISTMFAAAFRRRLIVCRRRQHAPHRRLIASRRRLIECRRRRLASRRRRWIASIRSLHRRSLLQYISIGKEAHVRTLFELVPEGLFFRCLGRDE